MKTQIKRLSKSTLAVVLTLCMLFSCATVGIIATDAAKVSDSSEVGARMESDPLGYSLSTGARFYLNAHEFFGTGVKKYVYVAFLCNNSNYYQIVKMDHISNTQLYTVTTTGNVNSASDMSSLFFFTTDQSGWACTSSSYYVSAYDNVANNLGGGKATLTYGANVYNNHVYYYTIKSDGSLTLTADRTSGNDLANVDSITYLKSGIQKASVYISTDGSNYTYRNTETTASNAGKGGEVRVGGYGWSTAFVTTANVFASATSDSLSYSQFEKPVLTSYITMEVTEVYDGWYFQGWYDTSGNELETDTTYSYRLTSNSAKEVYARFLKPTYTSDSPANSDLKSNMIIVNQGTNSTAPTNIHIWNVTNGTSWSTLGTLSSTSNSKIKKYSYTPDGSKVPNAIIMKGNTTSGNDSNKMTGNITSGTGTDGIYYYDLSDTTKTSWGSFTHISASVTADDTAYDLGDTVELTAAVSGTLSSGTTRKFYYTTDGSTYYKIAETTDDTVHFYPPSVGLYRFIVTVQDSAGIETVRSALSKQIQVGSLGYYVAGNTELTGTNWTQFSSKGSMTNTSGTLWTKTFTAVPAGTHSFRITDIQKQIGSDGWTSYSDYTLTGNNVTLSQNGDNVQFTLTAKSKVTITFDATAVGGKYPVTVTVADVTAVPVTVYAGSNGSVTVTYGAATTDIEAKDNATIYVAEGESIDLLATPVEGYSVSKWAKNLNSSYSTEATLSGETINSKSVYVAYFTVGGGSLDFDTTGYSASSSFSIKYSTGTGSSDYAGSSGTALTASVMRSGDYDYWVELTAADLAAWKEGTSGRQVRWNLFSGTSSQITDKSNTKVRLHNPDGDDFDISPNDSTYDVKSKMEDYSGSAFVELSKVDSSVTALGIHYNSSTKIVTYYANTSSGGSGDDYVPTVNFYAKDTIYLMRDGTPYEMDYLGDVDTTVTEVENEIEVTEKDGKPWEAGTMLKGSKITVTTTIPDSGSFAVVDKNGTSSTVTAKDKYYVVGFSFNGITPEILSENNTGVYTCTYTIPTNMSEDMLEITPIFFIKEAYAGNTCVFYLNGYDDAIKNSGGWGNTLFVYPFYRRYTSGTSGDTTYYGQAENFGGYPGQPVVNNGGQLYTQIPLTNDGTTTGTDGINYIKGVTINNGYFDKVHQDYCKFVTVHKQTYDYDDFAKIYNEKKDSLHSIYFSFKYHAQNTAKQHRAYNTTNTASAKSRYNDMYATTGVHNSLGATPTAANIAAYVEANNGWEYLTDSLGNKVDLFGDSVDSSKVGTTAGELYVVSMGYEYNNSGEYATEWAVYYYDSANSQYQLVIDTTNSIDSASGHEAAYNSSIVPSALIMNSSSSFSSYTAMDGDQSIQGYSKLYEALEDYRGYPAKIVYEYDAPIAYNTPAAYRSDGRWTYTTTNDFVKSNIVIEYKGKNAQSYVVDEFTNTNQGTVTGCKAYFTNAEYYGAVTSNSEIISNNDYYNFTAEAAGSYEFVGWYMRDAHNKESTITEDSLTASTLRSGNFTLVARFDYVAEGTLTISNALDSESTGRGTTYLGVTLIYGDQETVIASVNSNTAPVKLDKSVIKSNSGYTVKVDIRTVPSGENRFDEYTCYTTNDSDVRSEVVSANDYYAPANHANSSDSYTFTVAGLYSGDTQNVKVIEYISSLISVKYEYSLQFTYTAREGGTKSFTSSGSLTPAQIERYTTGDTGSKTLKKEFIQTVIPFESNFNMDINWTVGDLAQTSYTTGNNTYSFTHNYTNATESATIGRTGYFYLPYAANAATLVPSSYENEEIDQVALDTGVTLDEYTSYNVIPLQVNYNAYYRTTEGIVTAPLQLKNGDDVLFFNYWLIEKSDDNGGEQREVAKCFYPELNYRALDNYCLTPVYGSESNYGELYQANHYTTVDYIGSNRNQWNANGHGTDNSYYAGDVVYNDLILSFKPLGSTLIKNMDSATTKVGVMIEKVQLVDVNTSGKSAYTLKQYEKSLADSAASAYSSAVTLATGSGTSINHDGLTLKKTQLNITDVNNKNRYHYTLRLYNSYQPTSAAEEVEYQNCKYLYRAFSYMQYVDGDGVTQTLVSEKPAYFYMYDLANE